MAIVDRERYLAEIVARLQRQWPDNRTIDIVCHGHSVPAGYFYTPVVNTFNAYPHLLHWGLKDRFPFAVINVIVTAVGGEASESGASRFERDVLCHRPDVLTIDYGLNDRIIGLARARTAWTQMVEEALAREIKVLLLTPTADITQRSDADPGERERLRAHVAQIRELAETYGTGLVDSLAAFDAYLDGGGVLSDLLSLGNHPNRTGHEIVARELLRWFPIA